MEKKDDRKGIIYCATNKVNGKQYIGQTISGLNKRKVSHVWCSKKRNNNKNNHFLNAVKKYGGDGFDWVILEDNIDVCFLNDKEIYYIEKYKTFGDGYNSNKGGELSIPSKETCRKMSESRKKMIAENKLKYGNSFTPDWRDNLSEGRKGSIASKETREKMSIANKGKKPSEECVRRCIEANTGRKASEESKKKMSQSRMGDKNHFKGKHHTQESKEKNAMGNHKRGVLPTNSSGFKGVQKMGKKWRVTIRAIQKKMYLGCFDDKVETAKVYDAKIIELYGKENVITNKDLGLY